jgi:hypothetical protein
MSPAGWGRQKTHGQSITYVNQSMGSHGVVQIKTNSTMNLKTKTLASVGVLTILTAVATTCRADDMADTSTNSASVTPMPPPRLFQPFTVGAEIGTTGYGGSADWRFSNHFGIGGGFDYLTYTYNGTIQGNSYDIKLHLQSEPLTLNLYPSKNSSFHVSVGALFSDNHISGAGSYGAGQQVTIGHTNYTGPVNINMNIKPLVVDPYLTLGGNLYFDHGHHVSLGGAIGVAYIGDPKVTFSAEPGVSQQDQQAQQSKIAHYAKDLPVWPILKLSFNVSF